ncbi:MAG: 4-hydroxy-tetrahydrodipicolinate reductase [Sutterellaceae bacterium]|nr:4-hydroxy-tetrahydrodipicolinate reductase [Burkholderiaceae bacterium]MDW8430171.1 4-hydroxy-tetrahydrodipicolinate reductase [Sutterellaceae bacterium]
MTQRIAIAGASGRMGRALIEAALTAADLKLAVALDRADSPAIGTDCAQFLGRSSGVIVTADLQALAAVDVLIDFTRPQATLSYLPVCVRHGVALVIGTTGFDADGREAIAAAARAVPIVFAPNMSVGINAVLKLAALAARILQDYDVEIIEAHHQHKVDAPSGTALALGEAVAAARGVRLPEVAVHVRQGHTGERAAGSIGFAVVRGGDIVGDHTVLFAGTGERIEITHRAASRSNYALGALRAARFLAGRQPGLYDMQDVLGLR